MSGFKYLFIFSNVLFINECGLSKIWNIGGVDFIIRYLVIRMVVSVIVRNR